MGAPLLFRKYLAQLDRANIVLKLDPRIYARLRAPQRLIRGIIRLERDAGGFTEHNYYRCQFNHARGATQGGTRYDLAVCEDEVMFLAAMMMIKNRIDDILHGGGKGGIRVDKTTLSYRELERLCRGYIRGIYPFIGPRVDGPAPDVNTGSQEMAWFLDEFERIVGEHSFAAFTGKPIELAGSLGRSDATALGAMYATEALMKKLGLAPPLDVSVQGFGNAASLYGKLMSERGHRIISASDRSGIIVNRHGFDFADLYHFCYKNGKKVRKVTEFPGQQIGIDPLFESLQTHIFAPAAFENTVDAAMAEMFIKSAKCKMVVELSNGACTEEADWIFTESGMPVLPDVYSSGGGVRVSAAEKIQGYENQQWPAERVAQWLRGRMFQAFQEIDEVKDRYGLRSYREAAMVHGLRGVADAMAWRGGFDYPYGRVIDVKPLTVWKDLSKHSSREFLEAFHTQDETSEYRETPSIYS